MNVQTLRSTILNLYKLQECEITEYLLVINPF